MNSVDFNLKERVKELNCLYAISKIGWEAQNDIPRIVGSILSILPQAMQHQTLAEANIVIDGKAHQSTGFKKCKHFIESPIMLDGKSYGKIVVGYRPATAGKKINPSFLPEEKSLLNAVSRELSLFVKRAAVESDKEQLQIQLQHAERLAFVGELTAGIAHELNEPLGRILGFAQLIKKAGNLDGQQSEDIERIVKASLYTREIIKKLMIFSRQMPQQITAVNMNQIIDNILYFIDVRYQSRGIKIIKKLDAALPDIHADEVQMSQVMVNLITNAVHAMTKGGQITILTKRKRNGVTITVRDTGIGMNKDVREKIFEPFFTTKAVGQGTGLGLSVVQGIIDSHQGRISVTSTHGKGSQFDIQLPLTQKKL